MSELPVFELPEFEMDEFDATCKTENCINANITLRVSASKLIPTVFCGPCMTQIEDVVPVGS
jgi:hypothetical protein